MPARDLYHNAVRNALIKDGWTITHDPYRLPIGQRTVYVDLGAQRMLAAQKDTARIAVEIKTFAGPSGLHVLENAVGQYAFSRALIARIDSGRRLFLTVPQSVREGLLQEPIARPVLEDLDITLSAFDPTREVITAWKA